ncbi:putative membrane protein [Pseudomonas fluorescens]|uniref:Putative membrane protein n=1 Tax=Pseudomonas fluorescens TaxID=294 RepID=A0A0P8X789_PSEFL|nr:putative membrane protein [Pseudomonas fluorescens]
MPRLSFAVRILFACCLFIATANHIRADVSHGLLWDYGYGASAYLASRIFWGALTFFDPLAALLLFVKPRAGIMLTATIILVDVIHNTFYVALKQQWLEPFYLSQVAFLIVVFLLLPIAWNGPTRDIALTNPVRV